MDAPQIVAIVLFSIAFAVSAMKHGEPRRPYDLWWDSIGVAIWVGVLWWGGFWS